MILSTILFHAVAVSPEPAPTLSAVESPVESVAYPTERTVTVRKNANPEMRPFFQEAKKECFIQKRVKK
jgi:hypothetical protein